MVCHQYTRNQIQAALQTNTNLTESEIKDAHVLNDVRDGSVYKCNAQFMESGITLKLKLYQDAFEIINPLGQKTPPKKQDTWGLLYTGQLRPLLSFQC